MHTHSLIHSHAGDSCFTDVLVCQTDTQLHTGGRTNTNICGFMLQERTHSSLFPALTLYKLFSPHTQQLTSRHLRWPSLVLLLCAPAFGIPPFSPIFLLVSLPLHFYLSTCRTIMCVCVCSHQTAVDRLIKPFSTVSFTGGSAHLDIMPRH